MTYSVDIFTPTHPYSAHKRPTLQAVRDDAVEVVHDRMEAFGEDHEALTQYGYFKAEAMALDMTEDGGTILIPDGWKIIITNNDEETA